ncbi:TetR/AcrR family transcriptional regulator [Nocardiopsis sp. MG754419]|uniref:TetR/AcrR family transcriptional regulator n=1 Tax=Nocardiopsis sp. MG754419 TaxID=2259865 RepID=UPI001BA934E9|nr:TetR/AcrR family transcriptional regulator [Nocardiopsis sp. MG754419]MBR8741022.1 TetR/AcrR family transcriptional regulator [Nocardiopsis sp. MG754419]
MPSQHSKSGDPARSLSLLWRTREPAGRRRGGPGLTIDRIVAAATELADSEGITALSMRRVADALGVGTMSLYTYVPGKGELLDLMVDAAYGDLDTDDRSGTWRERLRRIAFADRELYVRHPWMLQVVTLRLLGPHLIAKYDHELSAVDGLGLSDVEMDSTVNLVNGYVESTVRKTLGAEQVARESGMDDEQWWRTYEPPLTALADDARFPIASRVGTAVGRAHRSVYDPDHEFSFGLERVLDGVQALVDSRACASD